MMKMLVAVTVMIALLTAVLPGVCEGSAETPAEENSTARVRMLNDLLGYIYECEKLYGTVDWALDAFITFDAERTWDNLEIARASLSIARLHIAQYSLPELELTLDDQMELMREGVDASFMENLDAAFEGEKTTMINTCLNLNYGIMEGVFLRDDWAVCMQHVDVLRELMTCDIQYLANTADWVLATLDDMEVTERFHDVMDSYCPLTRACQAETLESPTAIEGKVNELFKQIESLLIDEAKIIGAHGNRLNVMTDLIDQGKFDAIRANMLEISGMPLLIFYPTWYEDDDIFYYWKVDGEVMKTPLPRTRIERMPDGCMITIRDVTKDEVLAYQTELEDAGLPCKGSSDKDGKITILYEYGDSEFVLSWEEGNTTILMTENPVCFIPRWYFKHNLPDFWY